MNPENEKSEFAFWVYRTIYHVASKSSQKRQKHNWRNPNPKTFFGRCWGRETSPRLKEEPRGPTILQFLVLKNCLQNTKQKRNSSENFLPLQQSCSIYSSLLLPLEIRFFFMFFSLFLFDEVVLGPNQSRIYKVCRESWFVAQLLFWLVWYSRLGIRFD